jgi:putative membrane protein
MKNYISLFFKGMGMGAANVIPGVSGGTIALITGIFEQLINSIKSFNATAIKLFVTGKFKAFAQHVNLHFLIAVFAGVALSILSIAKLFGYLLDNYPVYIMAFFFGLILASIYFVGKTINKLSVAVVLTFVTGTAIAVSLSLLTPAQENSSLWYLLLCGVVATCSMILPGLSGSFVLILMGNYQLVMIDAVNNFDLKILLPVVIGAALGLIAFSNILAWVYRKFRDQTIAILTGFILGSLGIIWPWKNEIPVLTSSGEVLVKNGKTVIEGYQWFVPESFTGEVMGSILLAICGIVVIWITETLASKKTN